MVWAFTTSRKGEKYNKAIKRHWHHADNSSKAPNALLTQAMLHHLQNNPLKLGKGPQVSLEGVNEEALMLLSPGNDTDRGCDQDTDQTQPQFCQPWRNLKGLCVNGSVAGVRLAPVDDLHVDTLYKGTDFSLKNLYKEAL